LCHGDDRRKRYADQRRKGRGVMGFDKTTGRTFDGAFISLHLQDAEKGDYESACWLRDNVNEALKKGNYVDPYLAFFIQDMVKGGLLKNCRKLSKKNTGERSATLGEHNQLLIAREMWKYLNLVDGSTNRQAQENVCETRCVSPIPSLDMARNSYYRFEAGPERHILLIELTRDYSDNADSWYRLCPDQKRIEAILKTISDELKADREYRKP
jgi:hypothetical protein